MASKRSKKSKKSLKRGKKLPSVKTLSKGQQEYLKYTLTDVLISS
jgi:type VI protein secretion system component Hcp